MNKVYDILRALITEPYINQRILSQECGCSLGSVNQAIKLLLKEGYLDETIKPTAKAMELMHENAPKNAVILAAGYGMRMVPINFELPKGLIEIHQEVLIERIILQLHEVGIRDITIVVGFMKEQYEYLIDKYQVELIFNPEYALKNNLHSLKRVISRLSNTYIIPCDIWCEKNPFNRHELYSWYMVSDAVDNDSTVRINRKQELVMTFEGTGGNGMIGICYLLDKDALTVKKRIEQMSCQKCYNEAFWEEALYEKGKMIVSARMVSSADIVEINTYEQLRELDSRSNHLKTDAIKTIMEIFKVDENEITNIKVLKKGMTNRSFLFTCKNQKYIMRIPGEGTDKMVNRVEEADVYQSIKGKGICDDVIYIDAENGYKITRYLENSRVCDSLDWQDVERCMKKLREFHDMKISVKHNFDIFGQILFYESLWNEPSIYRDYNETKEKIFLLKPYIEKNAIEKVLTHIDAVPDNFLFVREQENEENIHLIDWEYAGMQDPHVDIAMFGIYALYDREQIDKLISLYFQGNCVRSTQIKIYCYIAACGLLWSNWCEYKRGLGVEFGDYSLKQYRYAKEYFKLVSDEINIGGTK